MPGKVFLIEVMPTIPNLGSCIIMPRSGLMTMAAILSARTDYDLTLLFEPYVGEIDVHRIMHERPRFVLLNGLTTTAVENEWLAHRMRVASPEPITIIAGGEHATMYPERAVRYADVVVLYEGDVVLPPLLAALEIPDPIRRDQELSRFDGIWFRDVGGAWHKNNTARRLQVIKYKYDFRVFAKSRNVRSRLPLAQIPVQTSRGCTYFCSFCSWTSLFGKAGYYTRPINDVVDDVEHALTHTGIERFMVVDNLFAGDLPYTEELLNQIIMRFEKSARKPTFTVLCRADQLGGRGAFSDHFLSLMRRAGIWNISMGLESVDDTTLEDMRKDSTTDIYRAAAARVHQYDFKLSASFIAGYANDTPQTVLNIAPFASSIGCFTIQLYCQAITPRTRDWKRLRYRQIPGVPERFMNGHTVATFPKRMLPSTLQRTLFETARRFFNVDEPQKRIVGRIYERVWREVRAYAEALERVEREVVLHEGIYHKEESGLWILQEDRLHDLFHDRGRYGEFARSIASHFDHLRFPRDVVGLPLPDLIAEDDGLTQAAMRLRLPDRAWKEARNAEGV